MSETRKLVAILCSDVVGYSTLAGADEDRVLARLRSLRSDLIDPTIAVHNGRVVKRTGDGSVVEFRSVVDAVRCAIEVQNAMVERNAGVPEDRRILFRIGIHLGDVVEESDGERPQRHERRGAPILPRRAPVAVADQLHRRARRHQDLRPCRHRSPDRTSLRGPHRDAARRDPAGFPAAGDAVQRRPDDHAARLCEKRGVVDVRETARQGGGDRVRATTIPRRCNPGKPAGRRGMTPRALDGASAQHTGNRHDGQHHTIVVVAIPRKRGWRMPAPAPEWFKSNAWYRTGEVSKGRIPAVPCSLTARQVGVPKRTSHRIDSEQTSRRR